MKAKDGFDTAMNRARHLLELYDLLNDRRMRKVRSDWANRFKTLMHWPAGEEIVRVDGRDSNSMIVLRQAVGVDRRHFAHDYLSELLRASIVASVSALDRFMHDLVVDHSWGLLSRSEADVPKELAKLSVPVLETKRALEKLRADAKSRPGHIIKQAIQAELHRKFTFQKPDDVLTAGRMLGIEDFWRKVAGKMPGAPTHDDVIKKLRAIAMRRNQIVHEADLHLKTKAKIITLRDIAQRDADDWVRWINALGNAIDQVVADTV